MKEGFNLIGHSCPLGRYPSSVVPIGKIGDTLYAIYINIHSKTKDMVELENEEQENNHFVRYFPSVINRLSTFNYKTDYLFAHSPQNIDFYSEDNEAQFFSKLLGDKFFSQKNPFLRLSLAKATLNEGLITQEIDNCIKAVHSQEDEFIFIWCKAQINSLGSELYLPKEKQVEEIIRHKMEEILKPIVSELETFATANIDLAVVSFKEGEFSKAEEYYLAVLNIRKKAYGDEDPQVGMVYNNLGTVSYSQSRYQKAKKYFNKAVNIFEKSIPSNEIVIAKTLTNLAGVYEVESNFKEADLSLKKALNIYNEHKRLNDIDAISTVNGLGTLYLSEDRYEEAKKYIEEALEMATSILGKNHITTARIMNNLGELYTKPPTIRLNKAEELLKESLQIKQNLLGKKHPDLIPGLNSLARFYFDRGRYIKAEPLFKQALNLLEEFFDGEHSHISTIAANLAEMYILQKNYVESERLFKKSINASRKFFGSESKQLAISFAGIGQLYFQQGNYQKAEDSLKEAKSIGEKAFGKDSPNLCGILDRLAALYRKQARYPKAEYLYKRSLEISKDFASPRAIAASQNNLALLYLDQNSYEEAESLLQNALKLTQNNLECDYRDIKATLNNLFHVYYVQRKHEKVKKVVREIITILEKALGDEHKIEDFYTKAITLITLGDNYALLGWYYELLEEREPAIKAHEKALIITKNISSIEAKISIINSVCRFYHTLGAYQQLMDIAEKIADTFILVNIGSIYTEWKQEYAAKDFYIKALEISRQRGDRQAERDNLANLGRLYSQLEKKSLSQEYFEKASEIDQQIKVLEISQSISFLVDEDNFSSLDHTDPINEISLSRSRDEQLSIPFELIAKLSEPPVRFQTHVVGSSY